MLKKIITDIKECTSYKKVNSPNKKDCFLSTQPEHGKLINLFNKIIKMLTLLNLEEKTLNL